MTTKELFWSVQGNLEKQSKIVYIAITKKERFKEVLERRDSPLLLLHVRSKCRCILHSLLEASVSLWELLFPPCHIDVFHVLDEVEFSTKSSPDSNQLFLRYKVQTNLFRIVLEFKAKFNLTLFLFWTFEEPVGKMMFSWNSFGASSARH